MEGQQVLFEKLCPQSWQRISRYCILISYFDYLQCDDF